MADNQIKKEKKWLYFAIGLIVGFLISAVAFVVFAMIQSQSKSFTKTIEHIYSRENTRDTVVKYVKVRDESETISSDQLVEEQDTAGIDAMPADYDEVDFSYAEENKPTEEDVVVEDKILAQKTVKVRFKNAELKDIPARKMLLSVLLKCSNGIHLSRTELLTALQAICFRSKVWILTKWKSSIMISIII